MRPATIGLLAFAMIAVTLSGCSSPPKAADKTVNMVGGEMFDPVNLEIKKGQTVAWMNADSMAHNVYDKDGNAVGPATLAAGKTSPIKTFSEVGVWEYYCSLHSAGVGQGMHGKVTVTA